MTTPPPARLAQAGVCSVTKRITYPSQSTIREWLDYDPYTGHFRWKKTKMCGRKSAEGEIAGTRTSRYVYITFAGFRFLLAHRLAWICEYGSLDRSYEIDHIDCNPSNNAIRNLRIATRHQQQHNTKVRTDSSSGLKGARLDKRRNKWKAEIKRNGKSTFLGYFATAEEAHRAYVKAASEYFGDFARAS